MRITKLLTKLLASSESKRLTSEKMLSELRSLNTNIAAYNKAVMDVTRLRIDLEKEKLSFIEQQKADATPSPADLRY